MPIRQLHHGCNGQATMWFQVLNHPRIMGSDDTKYINGVTKITL
jgi:hypothetical protein